MAEQPNPKIDRNLIRVMQRDYRQNPVPLKDAPLRPQPIPAGFPNEGIQLPQDVLDQIVRKVALQFHRNANDRENWQGNAPGTAAEWMTLPRSTRAMDVSGMATAMSPTDQATSAQLRERRRPGEPALGNEATGGYARYIPPPHLLTAKRMVSAALNPRPQGRADEPRPGRSFSDDLDPNSAISTQRTLRETSTTPQRFRDRPHGLSGLINLANPWSSHNIANNILGVDPDGSSLGILGQFHFGNTPGQEAERYDLPQGVTPEMALGIAQRAVEPWVTGENYWPGPDSGPAAAGLAPSLSGTLEGAPTNRSQSGRPVPGALRPEYPFGGSPTPWMPERPMPRTWPGPDSSPAVMGLAAPSLSGTLEGTPTNRSQSGRPR